MLIDVGPEMGDVPLSVGGAGGDDHTHLDSALKIAQQIVFQKVHHFCINLTIYVKLILIF